MKFVILYKIKILVKTNEKNLSLNKTCMFMTQKLFFFLILLTIFIFVTPNCYYSQTNKIKLKTIVIDPGHGGSDPGAVGKISKEKDLTLKMSLMLGELIKKNYPNINVIYTRTDDKFVELYKRADIANKNNADLFICVHINASTSSSPYGTETFVMGVDKTGANLNVVKLENSVILKEENYLDKYDGFDPNDPETNIIFSLFQNANLAQSLLFAQTLQDNFTSYAKRHNRGVKQAGFWVLWKTTMPSVLIELGFISNPEEEIYLNSDKGQEILVKSMFDAFVIFKKNYEGESFELDKHKINNTAKPEQLTEIDNKTENIQADTNSPANRSEIIFKIQIATAEKKIEIKPQNFKSYQNVDVYLQNGVYKYTIGAESEYDKIIELHKKVKTDYSDSFIVAFKNGQRIPLNEARSEQIK